MVKNGSLKPRDIIYLFLIILSAFSSYFITQGATNKKIAVIEAVNKKENEWIKNDLKEIKSNVKEIKNLIIDIIRDN